MLTVPDSVLNAEETKMSKSVGIFHRGTRHKHGCNYHTSATELEVRERAEGTQRRCSWRLRGVSGKRG